MGRSEDARVFSRSTFFGGSVLVWEREVMCVCVLGGGAVREEGGESEEEQPDVNRKQKRERKKEEPLVFHYCRQKLNLPLVA